MPNDMIRSQTPIRKIKFRIRCGYFSPQTILILTLFHVKNSSEPDSRNLKTS
jgi:hypothetical protein